MIASERGRWPGRGWHAKRAGVSPVSDTIPVPLSRGSTLKLN